MVQWPTVAAATVRLSTVHARVDSARQIGFTDVCHSMYMEHLRSTDHHRCFAVSGTIQKAFKDLFFSDYGTTALCDFS